MSAIADGPEPDLFIRSRTQRPNWGPIPAEMRPRDVAEGYRLQHRIHDALAQQGIRRVGYKIGCTAPELQHGYGLDEPIHAGIFAGTRFASLREAMAVPMLAPLVECEIALVTATALDAATDLSDGALVEAVASVHLACEVIDARYGMPPTELGAPTLLTDDFLHVGFVLGPPIGDWRARPLDALVGSIEVDGVVVAGKSADVLSPFQSLRWLVGKLAAHGRALEAGAIVLTGSLVKPTPVRLPARSLTIAIEGLGALSLGD